MRTRSFLTKTAPWYTLALCCCIWSRVAYSNPASKAVVAIDSLKNRIDTNIQSNNTDTCILLNDLLVLATEHQKSGDYNEAIKVVRKGQGFKKMICERYGYMHLMEGLMHYHLGRKDSALFVFSKALDFANDNPALRRDIHLYLGLVQVRSGYHEKAVQNFRLSARFSIESDNTYTLLQSYSNSGVAHYNLGNKDSSLHFHKLSILSNKGECEDCKLNSLTSIGILFDEQGALDSASFYFNKVLDFEKQDVTYRGVFLVPHLSVGVILFKEGENEDALDHLQKALALIHKYNDQDHENLIQAYTYLVAVYSSLKNPKKASYYYEKSINVIDSVRDETLVKATAEAESKYQVKESLLQTQLLAKENALSEEKLGFQRAVIWTSTVATAVVSIFLIVLVFQRRKLAAINQTLKGLIKEKDHFMGLLTHDLRSPMSSIVGISDQLKGMLSPQHEGAELVDDIRKSGISGLVMMNDILDIYRFETTDEVRRDETVNLSNAAHHIANRYQSLALAKGQNLVRFIDPEVLLQSNGVLIKSILGNLVSNALKYTPTDGKVEVTLKREQNHVLLEIADNGPGFTKEDQSRAFQKFQTLSALPTAGEDSTGLGLYMVKVMVDRLGGEITLHSKHGIGSKFIVEFKA